MKREPFFANFWVRAGYDSALSPRLPLRIAFTALFFLLFAWLMWMIWPKPDISAIWFYGFGALTFVGLLFANEQVMYHRMFLTSKSKTWYGVLWSQTSIPLLVAMVLFNMVCYTPSFSFRELPETPLETAAKHWACVFFPVMVLFSVGLHLLLQYTKTEVDRRQFVKWKSMLMMYKLVRGRG